MNEKKFGVNVMQKKRRCKCKCSMMPLFYFFLLVVTGVVTAADYYLYEYAFWYAQGSAMLLMVVITALMFGCGRVRYTKREIMAESDLANIFEEPGQINVVRGGV